MVGRPEVGRVSLSDRQRLRALENWDHADTSGDGDWVGGVSGEDLRACGAERDPGVHVPKPAVVPRDASPGRRLYPGAARAVVLLHSSELIACRCFLTLH